MVKEYRLLKENRTGHILGSGRVAVVHLPTPQLLCKARAGVLDDG